MFSDMFFGLDAKLTKAKKQQKLFEKRALKKQRVASKKRAIEMKAVVKRKKQLEQIVTIVTPSTSVVPDSQPVSTYVPVYTTPAETVQPVTTGYAPTYSSGGIMDTPILDQATSPEQEVLSSISSISPVWILIGLGAVVLLLGGRK